MCIACDARYCEIGSYSRYHYLSDSLFSEVVFESCFIKWTYSSFCEGFLIRIVVELTEELDRPSIFLEYSGTWRSLEPRRDSGAIIIVLMESEMHPDDFFSVFSEYIDEFSCILDGSIFATELSHSLRCDLTIWVEKLVDEVDDDKCARHRVQRLRNIF
jgi:hypothetical protein